MTFFATAHSTADPSLAEGTSCSCDDLRPFFESADDRERRLRAEIWALRCIVCELLTKNERLRSPQ